MTYDFTPLFRSAIGFGRHGWQRCQRPGSAELSPPNNIEKTGETDYVLTMALAGFRPEDVDVVQEDNTLVVRGCVQENSRDHDWLHRGIATRAFERRFVLADHTEIDRADLMNGLLSIVVRQVVPVAAQPRRIPVHAEANVTEAVQAA